MRVKQSRAPLGLLLQRVCRASLFFLALSIHTIVFALLALLTLPLPSSQRYRLIAVPWAKGFVTLAQTICGIHYRIIGQENFPSGAAILLSKHQSAWETVAYVALMPRPLCFVFKRELFFIPFFGWGLALMNMIHIDRSQGSKAFDHVVTQGNQRLAAGKWILMFPEGTRTRPGSQGRYKTGGARLALRTQTPVVPIAMNSGDCWPRNAFIKTPGLITISIGAPISVADKTAEQINRAVETWIENEMRHISPQRYVDASQGDTVV